MPHCQPGAFGATCKHTLETIFHGHDVYANASELPPDARLDGWSPPCTLYEKIVKQYDLGYLVEVGVWKGKSAVCLADALRQANRGVLIAVDTWLGALEFWTRSQSGGKKDPTRDLHLRHGYPHVYEHFLSNVVQARLQRFVIPFPVPSRLAHDFLARKADARPDLVHIDAGHEYADAAEDIRLWWELLRPGGVLLGDDFQSVWPGVVRAACEHAARVGVPIFRPTGGGYTQKKWWVQKPLINSGARKASAKWLGSCMSVDGGWQRAPSDWRMTVRIRRGR